MALKEVTDKIKKNLALLISSKSFPLVFLILPLAVAIFIGLAVNNSGYVKQELGYYSSENSTFLTSLITEANPNFNTLQYSDIEKCKKDVKLKEIDVCLLYTKQNNSFVLELYTDNSNSKQAELFISSLSNKVSSSSYLLSASQKTAFTDISTVIPQIKANNEGLKTNILQLSIAVKKLEENQKTETASSSDLEGLISELTSAVKSLKTKEENATTLCSDVLDRVEELIEDSNLEDGEKGNITDMYSDVIDDVDDQENNLFDYYDTLESKLEDFTDKAKVSSGATSESRALTSSLGTYYDYSTEALGAVRDMIDNIKDEVDDSSMNADDKDDLNDYMDKQIEKLDNMDSSVSSQYNKIIDKIDDVAANAGKKDEPISQPQTTDAYFTQINLDLNSLGSKITQLNSSYDKVKNIGSAPTKKEGLAASSDIKDTENKVLFAALAMLIAAFFSIMLGTQLYLLKNKNRDARFEIIYTNLAIVLGAFILILLVSALVIKYSMFYNLLTTLVVMILTVALFTLLGIVIVNLVEDENKSLLTSISVYSVLLLFSGIILPFSSLPKWLVYVLKYNPMYMSYNLLKSSAILYLQLNEITNGLLILLIVVVVLFLLADNELFNRMLGRHTIMSNLKKDEPEQTGQAEEKETAQEVMHEHHEPIVKKELKKEPVKYEEHEEEIREEHRHKQGKKKSDREADSIVETLEIQSEYIELKQKGLTDKAIRQKLLEKYDEAEVDGVIKYLK